jgi:peptide/nickel transport system permease protein
VTAYLIRRAATAIVVLLGVSVFIFGMLHVIYPTPAIDVLGPHANKFSVAQWNRQHGFDDPWVVQYLRYIGQVLHGNLGYSYKLNQSVVSLFRERWERSAYLSGVSLVLSIVIAIPLGIYQAIRRNTLGRVHHVRDAGLLPLPDRDRPAGDLVPGVQLRGPADHLDGLDHP